MFLDFLCMPKICRFDIVIPYYTQLRNFLYLFGSFFHEIITIDLKIKSHETSYKPNKTCSRILAAFKYKKKKIKNFQSWFIYVEIKKSNFNEINHAPFAEMKITLFRIKWKFMAGEET